MYFLQPAYRLKPLPIWRTVPAGSAREYSPHMSEHGSRSMSLMHTSSSGPSPAAKKPAFSTAPLLNFRPSCDCSQTTKRHSTPPSSEGIVAMNCVSCASRSGDCASQR